MPLLIFLVVINLLKLWLGRFLPMLGDEAYYNVWAHHLSFGYVDHPPMIAYINWLINHTLGQNEFAIRLTALLCILISTWLIYLAAKEAFGKKAATAAAILFNLIPTYFAGGMFLTPEQPLLIAWLLSLYLAIRLFKTQQALFWYPLGIAIGLGCLSKFPMLLFLPGVLLFLLLSKENRHWLTKKEPYLALILSLLIFSPVIIWNLQRHFPSFVQHGARLTNPDHLNNILTFFVLQFLMYSPPLFIFACALFFFNFWKKMRSWDTISLLLICLSLPAFLAFLLISPLTQVGGHWTSIVYLGLIILAGEKILSSRASLAAILVINILFVGYYAFLFPIPDELKGRAYSINGKLAQFVQDQKVNYVYSDQMGVAGLVAFYGRTEVYMPRGGWRQFDIFGQPALKKGDDILYFSFDRQDAYKILGPYFNNIDVDWQKRLFAKDSDITNKTVVLLCQGFKGGELP